MIDSSKTAYGVESLAEAIVSDHIWAHKRARKNGIPKIDVRGRSCPEFHERRCAEALMAAEPGKPLSCGLTCEYCEHMTFAVNRMAQWQEATGIDWRELMARQEESRDYWYMNFWQEANQPKIEGESVLLLDTVDELREIAGDGLRCGSCHEVTRNPYECDKCGWKVYGFLQCPATYVFVKSELRGEYIFTPIAIEEKQVAEACGIPAKTVDEWTEEAAR